MKKLLLSALFVFSANVFATSPSYHDEYFFCETSNARGQVACAYANADEIRGYRDERYVQQYATSLASGFIIVERGCRYTDRRPRNCWPVRW